MGTSKPAVVQSTRAEEAAQAGQAGSLAARASVESPAGRSGLLRGALLLGVALLLIALDLWSKAYVFGWLSDPATHASLPLDEHGHSRYPLVGEWLTLMLNLNYGAAFGRLANIPYVLVAGRGLAILLILWLLLRSQPGQRAYTASLVLILAGAVGNLYDNLAFHPPADAIPRPLIDKPFGPVRDFIDVYFAAFDWHFPTFNIADSCISVGAVLLLLSGFLQRSSGTQAHS